MKIVGAIFAALVISLSIISCATSPDAGKEGRSASRSSDPMPPAWGGQYGGK